MVKIGFKPEWRESHIKRAKEFEKSTKKEPVLDLDQYVEWLNGWLQPIWKLGTHARFQSDYMQLNPRGKWIVTNTLNAMTHMKNPLVSYEAEACDECMPNLYLFGIDKDGIGHTLLEMLIYVDKAKKILTPVAVSRTTPRS